jgi:hypothetical protein
MSARGMEHALHPLPGAIGTLFRKKKHHCKVSGNFPKDTVNEKILIPRKPCILSRKAKLSPLLSHASKMEPSLQAGPAEITVPQPGLSALSCKLSFREDQDLCSSHTNPATSR